MSEATKLIEVARERAIITPATAGELEALRAELFSAPSGQGGLLDDLDLPRDASEAASRESSEAPRFIRGFHDVLITIGILVALGGLWSLASAVAVIPAIIFLSEIFVKRQRLALPAFTLTLMMIAAVSTLIGLALDDNDILGGAGVFFGLVAAMAVYYWRYRVPIAMAGLIWSGFGLVFFLILSGLDSTGQILLSNPRLIALIGLALTIGLFAVAMRFDMRDRMRVTLRSDVAFWLHLATAPLLLYSVFFLLFGDEGFWWSNEPRASEAMAAIGIITLMILIGIIIDRRAFVTSGLISLGVALGIITRETGFDISSITAFAFLAVGVIVLLLGAGWQQLRAFVLGAVPESIQAKLPPVAG